jgi:hypothetical protein
MCPEYLYGEQPAETEPAAGVKGILIRDLNGEITFRVYHDDGQFTDYEIRHDDLGVTIDENELASFYKVDGHNILDHSPEVLGLEKLKGDRQGENEFR